LQDPRKNEPLRKRQKEGKKREGGGGEKREEKRKKRGRKEGRKTREGEKAQIQSGQSYPKPSVE